MTLTLQPVNNRVRATDTDRIVKQLQQGKLVILPFDTVYGLVSKAFDPSAFTLLNEIKSNRRTPYTVVFNSLSDFENWFGALDILRIGILHKLLPGPVTIVLNANDKVPSGFRHQSEGFGVRIVSDALLSSIKDQLGSPLWASSTNRSGEPPPFNYKDIQSSILQHVEIGFDNGPTQLREASTVIDLRETPFRILRKGAWLPRVEKIISRQNKKFSILTVCTGNICRSPVAAKLIEQLLKPYNTVKFEVTSSGIGTIDNTPATPEMVQVGREYGVNLENHRARQISKSIIDRADLILVVSQFHQDYILGIEPDAAFKIHMLGDRIGEEKIPDPYQRGIKFYRTSGELIHRAAKSWAEEINSILNVSKSAISSESPEGEVD